MAIWYFCGHFGHFHPFWYVLPSKSGNNSACFTSSKNVFLDLASGVFEQLFFPVKKIRISSEKNFVSSQTLPSSSLSVFSVFCSSRLDSSQVFKGSRGGKKNKSETEINFGKGKKSVRDGSL
jgi:hypothetical protein